MKCCICGKEQRDGECFNNPNGAVDENKKLFSGMRTTDAATNVTLSMCCPAECTSSTE